MDELVWQTPRANRLLACVVAVIFGGMCLVGPAIVGLGAAGLDRYPVVLIVLAALGLGFVAWLALRTMGPSGLGLTAVGVERHHRVSRVTPWAEVVGMWILSNGRIRTLHVAPRTGDRYWLGLPETVGDDEVRDAVRRLSGGTVEVTSTPPVEPAAPGGPVEVARREFRVPARLLLVPAVLAVLTVAMVGFAVLSRSTLLIAPTAPVALWTALAVWRVTGRSVMDVNGFTVSGYTVPWSAISSVHEERVGPWRTVRVIRKGARQGTALRGLVDQPPGNPRYGPALDAVRAACGGRVAFTESRANPLLLGSIIVLMPVVLIAVPVVLTKPWEDYWWPGVSIATSTPDTCALLRSEPAHRLVPDATRPRPSTVFDVKRQECELDTQEARLSLTVERSEPGSGDGAEDRARENYAFARQLVEGGEPLQGVGDEAVIEVARQTTVVIAIRRANVVFRLSYAGRRTDTDAVRADAVAIARAAAASVRLR
jgi:hypothetical protein